MLISAKLNSGEVITKYSPINIGDYVIVTDYWQQYDSFLSAFIYFWGSTNRTKLTRNNSYQNWKVMNIALHPNALDLIYHIRSIKGENAVVSNRAITLTNFHRRNRDNIRRIIIYQISKNTEPFPHEWDDKLWDFYENGKIVSNKRRKIYI